MSKIAAVIQKMKNDTEYRRYFFRNAPKYQNLYLWLKPLFQEGYFDPTNIPSPIEDKKNKGYFSIPQWDVLDFLEAAAIQNQDNYNEETTRLLLEIVDVIIAYQSGESRIDNFRVDWYAVKILFTLPSEDITLEHIDFIGVSLRKTKFGGLLHSDLGSIVLPVLIEHKMKEHLLRVLPILFECETREDGFRIKEREPLVEQYWLYEITKKYPKQIANVVGISGVELLIGIMDEILESDAGAFNNIWIPVVEEHEQNSFPDRYDNQLVSFVRDMIEEASDDEVATFVQELFEKNHPIFTRLVFHTINHHYSVIKTEFWKWLKSNDLPNSTYRHEVYRLFQVRASEFSDEELDKAIEWIENFDYSEYYDDMIPEQLEKLTAYRRKEWLMTLKDYSEKANELFMEYDSISPEGIDHPGFDFWVSSVRQLDNSPLENKNKFCSKSVKNIVNEIVDFNPKIIKKYPVQNENDWIEGLARDLGNCVQKNPQKFVAELEKFQEIDLVYYYYIFDGLERAWQDKERFDWQNVFDLIERVLDASLLASNEKYAIWVKGKIPELIRAGTLKDDNAFDKEHLPRAKKILLDLLYSPEQEDGVSLDNLFSYSLNATNGKVLHGLMSYALRYGRLHSDKDIRWEEDLKSFFSEQLDKDDSYSLYVFNILGEYLPNIRFLDKKWVEEKMDKIFPIENEKLWQASFMSYMASSTMVYQNDYEYFRDNGHFTKALQHDWKDGHIKEKVLQFIVIAYMNSFDENTVFQIISEKDVGNTLEIIRFVWHLYRDNPSEKVELINKLWNTIYVLYKDDVNDDMQQIFSKLSEWFVFIDSIDETNIQWLELSAKYTEVNYNSYFLLEQLLRLVEDNANYVGQVYLSMLSNGVYPTYKEEDIVGIVEKLFENRELTMAREICNKYASEGVYFLNDVNKRYKEHRKEV